MKAIAQRRELRALAFIVSVITSLAILVSSVLGLYAVVRLSYPRLAAYPQDPSLFEGELAAESSPVFLPGSPEAAATPPKPLSPEEIEAAKKRAAEQHRRDYANALFNARWSALDELAAVVSVLLVACAGFLIAVSYLLHRGPDDPPLPDKQATAACRLDA